MQIRVWNPSMTDKETKDLAYWERNMLALRYARGWYYDLVPVHNTDGTQTAKPRYDGWARVLTLEGGRITFHIPDDFDVGTLPAVAPDWDGHTTHDKWAMVMRERGITPE